MHQQYLAGLQAAAVKHIAPDGKKSLGQRCRLGHRQRLWHRQALPRRGHCVFSIPATVGECTDPVTRLPARHTTAHSHHFTRHLQAQDRRGAGRGWVEPLALRHIGPVDARCHHPDQHLARAGFRPLPLRQLHHFGITGFGQIDIAHQNLCFPYVSGGNDGNNIAPTKKPGKVPGFQFMPSGADG